MLRTKLTRFKGLRLIIFDLDKTLARCNVSFAFGQYLYKRGELHFSKMFCLVCTYFLQKCGFCSLTYLHTLAFRLIFKGQKKAHIASLVSEFLAQQKDDFFRSELVCLLKQAQSENIAVWIQSSSPHILVQPIAQTFNVQNITASTYSVGSEGKFSHIDSIVDGQTKKNLFLRYIQERGIKQEEVACYSDSSVDLPILESVGEPVVVSGDKKLIKIARKRAWQIL